MAIKHRDVLKGSADVSVTIRALDTSGLPFETMDALSPLPTFWYRRQGAALVAFAGAALASLASAHADGGIEHIDDGYCRLDVPDAAFASGADDVLIGGTITGGVIIGALVPLVDFPNTGTGAANLRRGGEALVRGTVSSGSSATVVTTDLTEVTNDHYNGRTITFTSGALAGQSSSISDYDGASKNLTVVALTEAPAQGDEFVIS